MDGRMTVAMNAHREICAIQKAGGTPITAARVVQCTKIAAVKVAEITAIIQATLKHSRDIKITTCGLQYRLLSYSQTNRPRLCIWSSLCPLQPAIRRGLSAAAGRPGGGGWQGLEESDAGGRAAADSHLGGDLL